MDTLSAAPSDMVAGYFTTREAAKRLGVSVRTAQLWSESGRLEAWKTEGGHRRISATSVERLLESGKHNAPASNDVAAAVKLKVLIVEDDNVMLKLYRMRFESWKLPLEVITVSNGVEALILTGREMPDLMVTDLNMPYLDGFQTIRTLVGSPFREGMEIVAVSGLDEDDILLKGGLPPGVPILSKPVPFDLLRQLCESLIERRQKALETS